MTDQPPAPFVYIDANPFIYAIEGNDAVAGPIKDFFATLSKRQRIAITSELTLAEVLPKAHENRRSYLDLMIWSGIFDLKPVTREILIETADYRRVTVATRPSGHEAMLKLPDAIHVVTAIRSGCRRFLSTDIGIRVPAEMRLLAADGAGISTLLGELREF